MTEYECKCLEVSRKITIYYVCMYTSKYASLHAGKHLYMLYVCERECICKILFIFSINHACKIIQTNIKYGIHSSLYC